MAGAITPLSATAITGNRSHPPVDTAAQSHPKVHNSIGDSLVKEQRDTAYSTWMSETTCETRMVFRTAFDLFSHTALQMHHEEDSSTGYTSKQRPKYKRSVRKAWKLLTAQQQQEWIHLHGRRDTEGLPDSSCRSLLRTQGLLAALGLDPDCVAQFAHR